MNKVVVLVHLVAPGGGEKIAMESATSLDPERYDRTLCIGRWHEIEEQEPTAGMLRDLEASGARILPLRRKSKLDLRAWLPLIRFLRRERVDILHGHLFGSNLWACLIGRLTRVPVIVCHEHMWSYARAGRLRAWVDRWLIARWSDAFIAVSERGRHSMIEIERIPPEDVVLIRNGVPDTPPGDGAKVRRELGIEGGAPVIVSVGLLREEKAYEVLIDAAAKLVPDHPGLRVLIAGEGPERGRLQAQIESLGLGGVVSLLGLRADVPDLLAAADLAVCCSNFEGGPLSVMEYMGAALAVVATRVGGLPELIEEDVNGLLVPPQDPDALAAAAADLLGDEERRRRLGEAGRSLREREYGIDAFIGRLDELYRRLLAAAGR